MEIRIDKKVAGLMIASLLVGGAVGGAVGFAAGHEGDHGERGHYGMNKQEIGGQQYDNQADGETNDDNGGAPNSDEMKSSTSTPTATVSASTTIKTR